jgi:hypothetical protein
MVREDGDRLELVPHVTVMQLTQVTPPVDREELSALRDKYARMRVMRLAHDAGEEEPEAVRSCMAELASRFPGALREIDDLELAEIDRRIDRLGAALAGTVAVEPWMRAIALFHRLARGALCAKRWLRGNRAITPELAQSFRAECAAFAYPEEARAWEEHLEALAAPPGGRWTDLVYARIAAELQVSGAEARRLAFGTPRRSREP